MTAKFELIDGNPHFPLCQRLGQYLSVCKSVQIVVGFATSAGLAALTPLLHNPAKLDLLLVGSITRKAVEVFDELIKKGVPRSHILCHLGYSTRKMTAGFGPILHSKVYYFELDDNRRVAFVGSHNLTQFALGGLNGEMGVLIEGNKDDTEFAVIRNHIALSRVGAKPYGSFNLEGYLWRSSQFFAALAKEGLGAHRRPDGGKTLIIFAETATGDIPSVGEDVYLEISERVFEQVKNTPRAHLYLFSSLPGTASEAYSRRNDAIASMVCDLEGYDRRRAVLLIDVNWYIENARKPYLRRVGRAHRPTPPGGIKQLHVSVATLIDRRVNYQFEDDKQSWSVVLDRTRTIAAPVRPREVLERFVGKAEREREWIGIANFERAGRQSEGGKADVMREASPSRGAYLAIASNWDYEDTPHDSDGDLL